MMPLYVELYSFYEEKGGIHRVNVTAGCVDWVLFGRWVRAFGLGGNGVFLNGR